MGYKKVIEVMQEKIDYLFDNPNYIKIDIILIDIIKAIKEDLSPTAFKRLKTKLDSMSRDLYIIKKKRIDRGKRNISREINKEITHDIEKSILQVEIEELKKKTKKNPRKKK